MSTNDRKRGVKSLKPLPEQFGTDELTLRMFAETLRRARKSRRLLEQTKRQPKSPPKSHSR